MTDNPITIHRLSSFDDIADALEILTRDHALAFRLGVGAVLLDAFYDGDLRAYQSRGGDKEHRFEEFFTEMSEPMARIGIGVSMARKCIRAMAVWRTLPEDVRTALALGQLVALTRIADGNARGEVAAAAVRHGWTQRQLFDAIDVVRGGGTLDIEAIEASDNVEPDQTDPATIDAAVKGTRQPGRLVTEAEKWTRTIDNWSVRWGGTDVSKLRPAQRQRLIKAVERLEARAAALHNTLSAD